MSMRHQLWMCRTQLGILGKQSENYLYPGDIDSYPNEIDLSDLPDEIQNYIREANIHTMKIFESRDFVIKGHCFRPGCVLALDYIDFWPSYGDVDRILVIDYQKSFLLVQFKQCFICISIYCCGAFFPRTHTEAIPLDHTGSWQPQNRSPLTAPTIKDSYGKYLSVKILDIYTTPHVSGRVMCFHVGGLCVCPSACTY